MVERCTFNSLATALVDIPVVTMLTARSLKTSVERCFKTAKEKCSLTGINKVVHNIREKYDFIFLGSNISAHETWDQHFTCSIYISVQCISH
jgi:hypothetical protein